MKWELHTHTAEGSMCGKVSAAEVVARHLQAGFTGIVITDHFNGGTLKRLPGLAHDRVKMWLEGYETAHAEGKRLGLTVILGAEIRFPENDNDFLIYGIEPEFLLENPDLYDADLATARAAVHRDGAVIIQAHPSRLAFCFPVPPDSVDGYEVFNGNPRQQNHNAESFALAEANPELIRTSGSDYHQIMDLDIGSVETDEVIATSLGLAACLRGGAFRILRSPTA